jgi:hypothetical protein
MTRADALLSDACEWLGARPRLTCALLCAAVLGAFWFEGGPIL